MSGTAWAQWEALDAELVKISDGLAALDLIAPYRAGSEASQAIKAVRFIVTELETSLEIARDATAKLRPALVPQAVRDAENATA